MIHIFTTHESQVLAVEKSWLSWGEFHNKEAAFRVPNIHKYDRLISTFNFRCMAISIFCSQTDPIIQKGDCICVQDYLSTSPDDLALIVRHVRGHNKEISLGKKVMTNNYAIDFAQ
jgi:hypothetical protein